MKFSEAALIRHSILHQHASAGRTNWWTFGWRIFEGKQNLQSTKLFCKTIVSVLEESTYPKMNSINLPFSTSVRTPNRNKFAE